MSERPNIAKRPTEDMTLYTGLDGAGCVWIAVVFAVVLMVLTAANAWGAEATNIRIVDADTFECDVECEFGVTLRKRMIRIYNLDAWEDSKSRPGLNLTDEEWEQEIAKGKIATASLTNLLKLAKKVTVREAGRMTLNRHLCEVYADDVYVADYMKAKGHQRGGGEK